MVTLLPLKWPWNPGFPNYQLSFQPNCRWLPQVELFRGCSQSKLALFLKFLSLRNLEQVSGARLEETIRLNPLPPHSKTPLSHLFSEGWCFFFFCMISFIWNIQKGKYIEIEVDQWLPETGMLCKFYLNCRKNRTRKCIKEKSRKKKYPLELHHPKPNTLHTLFQFMFYSKWDRGQEGWMASPTQWTRVWASSRSWWWTGTPSVLQSMGLLRQDWETELNWCSAVIILTTFIVYILFSNLMLFPKYCLWSICFMILNTG